MKSAIFVLIIIAFVIQIVGAGLFASDIPPTSDGQLWQPIEKFEVYQSPAYGVPGEYWYENNRFIFYIVYKNQYNEFKYESVSITDYYTTNVTEKCRC
jgi:hypothetical protein